MKRYLFPFLFLATISATLMLCVIRADGSVADEPPSMDNLEQYIQNFRRYDRSSLNSSFLALETLSTEPDFMDSLLTFLDHDALRIRVNVLMIMTDEDIVPDPTPYLPRIKDAMADRDEYVSLIAARVLMLTGNVDDEAVDVLVSHFDSDDTEIRQLAVWTITYCGEPACRVVPRLVEMLDDEDPGVRNSAIRAIGNLGIDTDGASEKIRMILDEEQDDDARFTMAKALVNLGYVDSEVIDILVENTDAEYYRDWSDAIELLGALGPDGAEALERLADAYSVANEWKREYLADAIGNIDPDYELPEIDEEATSVSFDFNYQVIAGDDEYVQQPEPLTPSDIEDLISQALTVHDVNEEGWPTSYSFEYNQFDNPMSVAYSAELVSQIAEYVNVDDKVMCTKALEVLELLGPQEGVIELFIELLGHEAQKIRRNASHALSQWAAEGHCIDELTAVIDTDNIYRKLIVYLIFSRTEHRELLDSAFIYHHLHSDDPDIQMLALGLANLIFDDYPDILDILLGLMDDDEQMLSFTALDMIGTLGEDAAPAIPVLIEILVGDDVDKKSSAAFALGGIGPSASDAVPYLVSLLDYDEYMIQMGAMYGLSRIGVITEPAVAELIELMDDEEGLIREQAAATLLDFGVEQEKAWEVFVNDKIEDPVMGWFIATTIAECVRKNPDYLTDVINLLRHENDDIIRLGFDVLKEVGPEASEILPELCGLEFDDPFNELALRSAIESIAGGDISLLEGLRVVPEITDAGEGYIPVEFYWSSVLYMMEEYTKGFFILNQCMPESLQELTDDGWYPFLPAPAEVAPNLRVVDRRLVSWEEDRDSIRFDITSTGYIFQHYEGRDPGQTPYVYDYSDADAAEGWLSSWDTGFFGPHFSGVSGGAQSTVYYDYEIRHSLMGEILDSLTHAFFRENGFMPRSLEEFYHNRWLPNEASLLNLPIYPEGEPGYFRYGVVPGGSYVYTESVGSNGVLSTSHTSHSIEDGGLSMFITHGSTLGIEDILILVDSSLPGWGLLEFPISD